MEKEKLGELILDTQEGMYRMAKTLLRSDADCFDAIQEAILKAFSKIHTLRRDEFAKTWLMRILMNECYTILRRNQKLVSMEDYPQREGGFEEHRYTELYEALMELPREMRVCVTLYYLEGYSVKEVASLLEVTESAVKNRLSRARMRLRRILEGEQDFSGAGKTAGRSCSKDGTARAAGNARIKG